MDVSDTLNRQYLGVLEEAHEEVARGNSTDPSTHRRGRGDRIPPQWCYGYWPGGRDGRGGPDSWRLLPSLRLKRRPGQRVPGERTRFIACFDRERDRDAPWTCRCFIGDR